MLPFFYVTCLSYDVPGLVPPWILFFCYFSLPCASFIFLCRFMYQRAGNIARDMAQLRTGIGDTAWCMSSYIRPSGAIHERYTNNPKRNKLEGLILVWESNRSLWRKGVEVPVYYFFHGDFSGVEFFTSINCVHVVEEGPD